MRQWTRPRLASRLLGGLVLGLWLWGSPPSAQAAYTAPEVAALRHLRLAMLNILDQLERSCGGADTADACTSLIQGFYEVTQAVGWLFHVNVNPNDAAGDAFLQPYIDCFEGGGTCTAQRAPVVAEAWRELDRALFELNRASAFRGQVDYDTAVRELGLVDRTLAYANPFPPLYPKKFGPHGNYDRAQQHLWSVIQYGLPALQAWFRGVKAGTLPACPAMVRSYARGLTAALVDTWFLAAHVIDPVTGVYGGYQTPFTQGLPDDSIVKRALTEFALINRSTDNQGSRAAMYHLRLVEDAAAGCLRSSNEELWEFMRRVADSWEHGTAWTGRAIAIED